MDIMKTIREQVEGNRIILYMKGSPNQPQCGFSARTVQALMSCGERFAYVDVLSSPETVRICPPMPTGRLFLSSGSTENWWVAVTSSATWKPLVN